MPVTRINNNQVSDASLGNAYVGINAAAKLQAFSITSTRIANNLTYDSNLTITGNLTVTGNTTTIDTVNVVIEDPLILLAKEQTGAPSLDIGYIGKRGTEENIAFVWDESGQEFATIFTPTETTNTVVTINSYASIHSYDATFGGNLDVTGETTFTGNLNAGNIGASGEITALGNITGGNVIANSTVYAIHLETTGNATIGGNLVVQGNLTYINIDDLRVEDPIIVLGTGPNGAPLSSDDGLDRGIYMEYYTTGLGNAFMGWQNSTGNIIIANDVDFSGNDVIAVNAYGTLQAGNIYAESGLIDGDLLVQSTANVNEFNAYGVTANIAGNLNIKTTTSINEVSLQVNSTDSILVPVGNTLQRPATGVTGMVRFNTTTDSLEFYDADSWVSAGTVFTIIVSDQFNGDGSTVAFTLSEETTTAGTIIAVNGVVQIPTVAYSVSGNILTFTEAPTVSDTIDARILTTAQTVTGLINLPGNAVLEGSATSSAFNITGNLIPTANATYNLGSPAAQWAEVYIAGNSLYLGDIVIKDTGNGQIGFFESDGTTPAVIDSDNVDTTQIGSGNSTLAVETVNGNVVANIANPNNGNANLTYMEVSYKGMILGPDGRQWFENTGVGHQGRELLIADVAGLNQPYQAVITNGSAGNLAYSEFISINNVGNTDSGWISTGINSSGYDDPEYPITEADDGYLLYNAPAGTAGGGNLVIGTGSEGTVNAIVFGAGGFATGNTQMTIVPDDRVHIEIPTESTSPGTGALTVVGGAGIVGNLSVGGNVNVSNTSSVTANNFSANIHVFSGDVQGWFSATGETEEGRRIIAVAQENGPAEIVMVNTSSNSVAYSEFIAINDVGNIDSGYISMGINSSTYNDPAFQVTEADDGYLLFNAPQGTSAGGNLIIATGDTGTQNAIIFAAGGFATGNTQMTIVPDDRVHIEIPTQSTSTGTGALTVAGGIGLLGNLNVGGDVNIVGNITLGGTGNTVVVEALDVDDPIIYTGANNPADNLDLGIVSQYNAAGTKYAGVVRDATDATYKIFGNIATKPTSTVDFSDPDLIYLPLTMGAANVTSTAAASSTTSGALKVAGGAGIGGAVYIGGLASVTGNITGGNLSVSTGLVTLGGIVNANANGIGNIGSATGYFNTVFAKATSAQYADLAEMYEADQIIEPGTVVCFGGTKEVTTCDEDACRRVAGVVSTNPSYIMNAGLAGEHVIAVALTGRVPTRVTGTVRKGDMMVATTDGRARAEANPAVGAVIGKSLADFDGADGVIEVVIGRL